MQPQAPACTQSAEYYWRGKHWAEMCIEVADYEGFIEL
jgi:uncharacterized protein with PIN domain